MMTRFGHISEHGGPVVAANDLRDPLDCPLVLELLQALDMVAGQLATRLTPNDRTHAACRALRNVVRIAVEADAIQTVPPLANLMAAYDAMNNGHITPPSEAALVHWRCWVAQAKSAIYIQAPLFVALHERHDGNERHDEMEQA